MQRNPIIRNRVLFIPKDSQETAVDCANTVNSVLKSLGLEDVKATACRLPVIGIRVDKV
jgi:hypothetical protein